MHHSTQGQQHAQRNLSRSQQAVAKMFARYDVQETSYHLYTGRVDLHLCDDAAPGKLSSNKQIYHPIGYEKVYLPLCKVADTPFHIQGDEMFFDIWDPSRLTQFPVVLLAIFHNFKLIYWSIEALWPRFAW